MILDSRILFSGAAL